MPMASMKRALTHTTVRAINIVYPNGITLQGSPSGGGHVPPGGDASRMTTTDDEVFMQKVYIGGMRTT